MLKLCRVGYVNIVIKRLFLESYLSDSSLNIYI